MGGLQSVSSGVRLVTRQGLVQVYTGAGKGKTTAALGLAVRALGHGWRVTFHQFLKGKRMTGEAETVKRLKPYLQFKRHGAGELIVNRPPTPGEIDLARRGLDEARAELAGGLAGLVVLDEVAAAVNLGLLPVEDVAEAVAGRAPGVEVVLTGRDMPQELLALADLISEIKAVRHPYERGIGARAGIEY